MSSDNNGNNDKKDDCSGDMITIFVKVMKGDKVKLTIKSNVKYNYCMLFFFIKLKSLR